MLWKIYYADGSTFSSEDGSWADAPARGALAMNVAVEEVGREVEWGTDYYIWWPDAPQPWGVDKAGLWDFLNEINSPLAKVNLSNEDFDELSTLGVKFGRSVATPEWRVFLSGVLDDPDFPVKTASTQKEQ